MFVPLHVKSEHSLGLGTAPVEDLARRAVEHGFPALAVTDVETLSGQVRLHHAARHVGVRAITGVELRRDFGPRAPGRKEGRLVLLARDRSGYESLCRIVTVRRGGRTRVTGDPLECLALAPRGLFYLSDDARIVDALLRAGVPSADVRFLWVRPGGELPPAHVRVVADPDVVMLDRADVELHALLAAIRQRVPYGRATGVEDPERHLPARREIEERFAGAPDALAECRVVAEACRLDLCAAPPIIPSVAVTAGETPDDALERRCRRRLMDARSQGRCGGELYDLRLARELDVVRARGLAGMFLVVGEIGAHARAEGLEIVGRGSAVGSLVVHLLGLSSVDPVAHGLLFERFLSRARADLPDVDLDVPSHRRDALLAWVFERFGAERVAMVAAHQTFRRRAAFREGLHALGMGGPDLARFAARLPSEELEGEVDEPLPLELLTAKQRAWIPTIERLIGRPRHLSVHPGGVVIADPRIDLHAPLERAPKGVRVTQYDLQSLARLGLVKIDLLGNRALTAIEIALRWIPQPVTFTDGDPETLATLREARTVGCFQIETPAVRSTLKRLPIHGVKDLVDALAIVRPGPAAGEAKDAFLRRARGEEPALAPHPLLHDALRATHAMLVYEEDVIAAIAAMTGASIEAADATRAALVDAGDDADRLRSLERAFVDAGVARGVPPDEARATWRAVARFASYAFNRAHATSYAQLAWRCAFLKTHHALAYACGVLDSYGGQYPLRTVAAEFARAGVPLLAPHVRASEERSVPEAGALRLGLSSIQRLTAASRARVLGERPYRDLADLIARAAPTRPELEALVLCGACDDLEPLARRDYPFAHDAFVRRLRSVGAARALEELVVPTARGRELERYRRLVRVYHEIRILHMHPSDHPMHVLRDEATRVGCLPSDALAQRRGERVRFAGVVAAGRRLRTRGGAVMQFVTFEDERGLIEAVVFPGVYAALRDPIRNPGPFLVRGEVAGDASDPHLVVSDVLPFYLRRAPEARAR